MKIFENDQYDLLPNGPATYMLMIRSYWYVGYTANLRRRASYRKSVLRAGKCNERLIQSIFNRYGVLPKYKILCRFDAENRFYKKACEVMDVDKCMNIVTAGNNAASHSNDANQVYARISDSISAWASTKRGKLALARAGKASVSSRMKPVRYNGKVFPSRRAFADAIGIPHGSVGYFINKHGL